MRTRRTRRLPVLTPADDVEDRIHVLLAAMFAFSLKWLVRSVSHLRLALPHHRDDGAVRRVGRNVESGTDHVGPIPHDLQAHPRAGRYGACQADAVVDDAQ